MIITDKLKEISHSAFLELYGLSVGMNEIVVNATKPEFEGDYTVVLFSFIKLLKHSPEKIGESLGIYFLEKHTEYFQGYNVIKGFLNLVIKDIYWQRFLEENYSDEDFGIEKNKKGRVMVEYSSPNTNKPLHLGHLRNNFLGWSIAELLKTNGYEVVKSCVVNDRGIHICKSMVAYQMFGNGATPSSLGMKGDHLVGDFYVKYNEQFKKETLELTEKGHSKESAEKNAPIAIAAQKMLVDWEHGEPSVMDLWKKMNGWVYEGFDKTYHKIGTDFDKVYYESNTYLLGKDLVEIGLTKGVFYQKEDGSVWIDLRNDGLDEKIVRRSDGTSVYITQDIGLAVKKYEEYSCDKSIYVVGDEQNYHFKVLQLICKKLSLPKSEGIYHLSYGMVELPTGKMKSREGTVVDADDLIEEMEAIAKKRTLELGKFQDGEDYDSLERLSTVIGLGALKFFLLRVDPQKKIIFNPEESIDFQGFTAPFIQFIHARIKSILRNSTMQKLDQDDPLNHSELLPQEKEIIIQLEQFPTVLQNAGETYNPSLISIYGYQLAKSFSSFYSALSVQHAESDEKRIFRIKMCKLTAKVLKTSMNILGIEMPERM